jgi:predicted ATP-dependent serine protease
MVETEGSPMNFIFVDYDQKIEHNMKVDEWMALKRISERLEQIAIRTNSFVLMLSQSTEEERIAASQRSMQPTSAVLSFFKQKDITGDRYFIRAQKNRFGIRDNLLEISYSPSTGHIKEIEILGPDYDLDQAKIPPPRMKR